MKPSFMSQKFQNLIDEIILHAVEIIPEDTYESVITKIVAELTKRYPLKKKISNEKIKN